LCLKMAEGDPGLKTLVNDGVEDGLSTQEHRELIKGLYKDE